MYHQLTSQRNYHQEKIGQRQYVKSASEKRTDAVSRSASRFSRFQMNFILGRRPVDFRVKPPANKIYCIDILPTVSGVDSALHCIFGQPNSNGFYYCNNTKKYRHRLANFILDKDNQGKISTFIEKFVLRVKNGSKDFPVASCTKDLYIKHRIKNRMKNEFNWRQPVERFEKLVKEYAKFVESSSSYLILSELEILAAVHDLTVHIYKSQSSSFELKSTLNRGYNEYLILYEGGGEWQGLKANTSLQHFCSQFEPDLFLHQPVQQTVSFKNLIKWSAEANCCNQETIASLLTLNPEDGDTPDELSLIHI